MIGVVSSLQSDSKKLDPRWEDYSGFIELMDFFVDFNRLEKTIEYYCHQKLAPSRTEAFQRSLRLPLIIEESPRMEIYPISGRVPESSLFTNRLFAKASNTNANVLASQDRWRVTFQNPRVLESLVSVAEARRKFVFPTHGVYHMDLISLGSLIAPGCLSKGREGWILHLTSASAIRKVVDRAYFQADMRDGYFALSAVRFAGASKTILARLFGYTANLSSHQLSLLREAVHLDIGKMVSILSKIIQKGRDILSLYLVTGYRIYDTPRFKHPGWVMPSSAVLYRNTIAALQACRIDINYDLTVVSISMPKWYGFWGRKEDSEERWPLDDEKNIASYQRT